MHLTRCVSVFPLFFLISCFEAAIYANKDVYIAKFSAKLINFIVENSGHNTASFFSIFEFWNKSYNKFNLKVHFSKSASEVMPLCLTQFHVNGFMTISQCFKMLFPYFLNNWVKNEPNLTTVGTSTFDKMSH